MDEEKFNFLLRQCQSRESGDAAMKELVKFYYSKIVIHITARYRNRHIGEDIAQDFFMKLLKLDIKEKVKHPTAWVFKICDNLVKDYFKKESRYKAAYINQPFEYTDEPFQKIVFFEYLEQINQLDAETGSIILLHMYDGYSLREISGQLNLNYNTVRQKFSRGIKKLKKWM